MTVSVCVVVLVRMRPVAFVMMVMVVNECGAVVDVQDTQAVGGGEVLWREHVLGWSIRHDLARGEQDMVCRASFVEVVRREDDRATMFGFLMNDRVDGLHRRDVEAGEGFVKKKKAMVLCDALRHVDPLPLSAGQLRQLTSRQLGNT